MARGALLSLAAWGFTVAAAGVPHALSIGGELTLPNGSPVVLPSVNFRVEVRDAAGLCVLYSENHLNENLGLTQGRYSLIVGAGSSVLNNVSASGTLDGAVFANHGPTPVANCATPTVNLNSGDERAIQIFYDIGSGYVALNPSVPVVSSAYALVAETLDGKVAADFLQVNATGSSGLNQANTEYAFSGLNWPRLKALIDGTSSQYFGATPGQPIDFNNQRAINVATPVNGNDAANKTYVDQNIGGKPLDVTAVGPMVGNGSTLLWDATANKWVAGTLNTSATGTAGGDLTGSYPNPVVANDAITAAKIKSTGGGTNRLLITDATTGATVGFGTCAINEVYAWTATGWACTAVSTLSPVKSVAGKTGVVVLNAADIGGLGTAALLDYGTSAGQLPRLLAGGALPALDGSLLYNLNATTLQSRSVASTMPNAGQVLGWNNVSSAWEPTNAAAGGIASLTAGTGLLGGVVTTNGTFSVDVGNAANKIVRENSAAQIAQTVGSMGAPAYAFAGDEDTGIYRSSADELSLATAGTSALTIFPNGEVATSNNISIFKHANEAAEFRVTNPFANQSAGILLSSQSAYTFVNFNTNFAGMNTDWIVGSYGSNHFTVASNAIPALTIQRLAPADSVYVRSSGAVGIGTSNPLAILDVTGTGALSALIVPRDTTANRPSGVNGMLRYNNSLNVMEGYINGAWSALSSGSSAGTVTNVAGGVGILGGSITTSGTLSVDVGAAANKIVQENVNAQIAQLLGSAALPSYSFAGDLNTGVYSPGADQVSLVTNGTSVLRVLASGNVGIGIDAGQKLSVAGSVTVDAGAANVGTLANTLIFGGDGDGEAIGSKRTTGGNAYGLDFYTASQNRLAITNDGKVGIGTTLPIAALDIAAVGSTSALVVPRDTTANRPSGVNGMLRYNNSLNVMEGFIAGAWSALSSGSSAGTVTNVAGGTGILGGPITTNGTLRVDVGSAANKIVQENANAQIAQTLGSLSLPTYSFAGDANTGVYSPGADQLALVTNGASALSVLANGYVGIGSSVPTATLDVAGNVRANTVTAVNYYAGSGSVGSPSVVLNGGGMYAPAASVLGFVTSGAERMRIDTNGLVGLGTSAPQSLLDVYGTGAFSALIVPRDTTANRPSGVNGMLRYNNTLNVMEGYIGGAWSALSSGSAAGTVTNVAGGTGILGGPITTNGTLSVDVGSAANKLVQENSNAQIAQTSGAVSLPSYSFAGNLNTGLYSPGANQLAVVTNGTAALNVLANGNVGIGTTAPSTLLTIGGVTTITDTTASSGRTSGSLVVGGGAGIGGHLWARSLNSSFTDNGVYTPTSAPQVFGPSVSISNTSNTDGTGAYNVLSSRNTAGVIQNAYMAAISTTGASTYSPALVFNQQTGASAYQERMRIDSTGSVGIGTTVPGAALDIATTGSTSAIIVPRDTTANRPSGVNGMLRYNNTLNVMEGYIAGAWSALSSGTSAGTVRNVAGGTGILGGPITTNGTLSVDVGSAANKIVQENANAQIAQTAGSAALPAYSFSGNTNTGLFSPSTNQLGLAVNGTTGLTMLSSGWVGIGTTAPTQMLEVAGAIRGTMMVVGGAAQLQNASNNLSVNLFGGGDLVVTNGTSSQPFVVKQGGQVGIGTSVPLAALDVSFTGTASGMLIPRDTTANRPAGVNGMLRYNTTSNVMEGYIGGAWSALSSGTSAGTVRNVAGGTGILGGPITSNGTLSVDVGSAANKIVQENANAQIAQTAGTVSLPAYAFAGNTSTGIYAPAANNLSLVTNGTARFNFDAAGHLAIGDMGSTQGTHLDDITYRSDNSSGWRASDYFATFYEPAAGSGTSAQVIAHYATGELRGAANVYQVIASVADATNVGTGSLNSLIASQAVTFVNNGTTNQAVSYSGYIDYNGGVINEYRGLNIDTNINGGTLPVAYGVFLSDLNATTAYGIYQQGANDINALFGRVGIGTDAPQAQLDVRGHIANSDPGVPVVSACGGGTITATSNDARGRITRGATAGTTCTITFSSAYASAPYCVISQVGATTAGAAAIDTVSTTQLAVRWATSQANVSFNYFCMQ